MVSLSVGDDSGNCDSDLSQRLSNQVGVSVLIAAFFGLSREIFLNVNANSIDRRFNFFGIKRMIERFPIEQTKSISVKQNPKNQYEFILEMESGLERILFVEDLKIDMDRHVALMEKFRAKAD